MVNSLAIVLCFYSWKPIAYKTQAAMITTDKVTEVLCILNELCKDLDAEWTKNLHVAPVGEGYKCMRNRKGQMANSEIMTILSLAFSSFRKCAC